MSKCSSILSQAFYVCGTSADALPDYVRAMTERGRKPLTMANIERACRKCCEALDSEYPGIPLEDVGDRHVVRVQSALRRTYKESTARGYLTRWGQYVEWVTGRDPVKHARLMWNECEAERVWIDAEGYRRLYSVAKPRERVMLALGATMGLRREEIMTLTVGQLRDGGIEIHGKGHGEDGKVEWRPMSRAVAEALADWMPERERLRPTCDVLLVSKAGKAMEKSTMDWIMRQLGKRAGVKATPHSLRRLFAVTMDEAGVDLGTMARMMRHSSPTTTMAYYLKADPRRMASASEAVDGLLALRLRRYIYYVAHVLLPMGLCIPDGVRSDVGGSETTPTKISERDVCRQLIDRCGAGFVSVLECGSKTVIYPFRKFREDMLSDSFVTSETAIRTKWTMLTVDGVVVRHGDKTVIDIPMLYIKAGMTLPPVGRHSTHTYTEDAEEGGL